jgi:hypothetical protein
MLAEELALTIAAVFTGAAIYINVAEQLAPSPRELTGPIGRATRCKRALQSWAGSSSG